MVFAPPARSWGGKMKLDAAAITPRRAKRYQNGTVPSAKSIQAVPLVGRPQGSAARAGLAVPAKQVIAMRPARTALLTWPMVATAVTTLASRDTSPPNDPGARRPGGDRRRVRRHRGPEARARPDRPPADRPDGLARVSMRPPGRTDRVSAARRRRADADDR